MEIIILHSQHESCYREPRWDCDPHVHCWASLGCDPRTLQVEMWVLLGMLSLILLIPVSTGPLVRPSLRPKHLKAGASARTHQGARSTAADEEQAASLLTQPLIQYEQGPAGKASRADQQQQQQLSGPGGVQRSGGAGEDSRSERSREDETRPDQDLSVGE